ncbi:head GIN domain-containing protein [Inhella gelatinilytica]|uniref:DUF2807 domain-containing protein n=1 Tax=Inhella gelatinilytica TaxID=2795030 RepID=A0A931IW46_9BURK|nr:head GIN domain-containing protein [Inhella gelatinilytica]MBH9553930.1 DUF2807 domain-containing protein [Inhella gelatinilytica]
MTFARRLFLSSVAAAALVGSAAAVAWTFQTGDGTVVRGDGQVKREARALTGFDAIAVSGGVELKVRQAGASRVELEADGNLLPYVETQVVNGAKGRTLEIKVKRGYTVQSRQPLRIEVDLPELRALAVAGSGSADVQAFKTEALKISVAGSGTVKAPQLEAGSVQMNVSGTGDVHVGGRAKEAQVSVAGSGDVVADQLAADAVKVSIAGSGDVNVQANKTLKVSIAGSGSVVYSGTAEVSQSIAGSGSVTRR